MSVDPRLDAWLSVLEDQGGTVMLLTDGSKPLIRLGGSFHKVEEAEVLTGEEIEAIARMQIGDHYGDRLHLGQELDFSFTWREKVRVLASAFYQKRTCALRLRRISADVPPPTDLGLPAPLLDLCRAGGLVVVTGPDGSGRSTTLASLVDSVNREQACHIVTVEDPIEYLLADRMAVVSQREVGVDTASIGHALGSFHGDAPDVVMVTHLPDVESVLAVLSLAERGRLVLVALPVAGAAAAVEWLVDVLPPERRSQARVQLSGCLRAVLYQRLLAARPGGQAAAYELLVGTPEVRRMIREARTGRLRAVMAAGDDGMMVLEHSLAALVGAGRITPEVAAAASLHPEDIVTALTA